MKRLAKIIIPIVAILVLCFSFAQPTFAYEIAKADSNHNVETIFFGTFNDDDGCGVFKVLNFVIDLLSMGIGIAAFLGITISGVLYLTAKGNEQQATKSKRRMFEIIIGIAIYATLFAGLQFLLPGGSLNHSGKCGAPVAANDPTTSLSVGGSSSGTSGSSQGSSSHVIGKSPKISNAASKLLAELDSLADKLDKYNFHYKESPSHADSYSSSKKKQGSQLCSLRFLGYAKGWPSRER